MQTRSGRDVGADFLSNTYPLPPQPDASIEATRSLDQLVQAASDLQDWRYMEGGDDAEGIELLSRSPTPTPTPGHDANSIRETPLASSSKRVREFEPASLDAPGPSNSKRYCTKEEGSSKTPGQKRRKGSSKKRRSIKRIALAQSEHPAAGYAAKPSVVERLQDLPPLKADVDAQKLPTSLEGSWVGKRVSSGEDTPWSLDELMEEGFRVEEWDGCTSRKILDCEQRIIAVLVGRPNDPTWDQVVHDAAAVMEEVREAGFEEGCFSEKFLSHRRGEFVAFPVGVSFGGGQKKPGNLVHPAKRQELAKKMKKNLGVIRIAGFQSRALAAFFPKFCRYLVENMDALFTYHKGLEHNFRGSVFPAISFNCGPRTVALRHTDYGNISHGICALTALGSFDHRRGGHLILFDLKLVLQFPPGATVLIPSGCLSHGNTPIQEDETRMSIAQYASGGLFRWVAYGFQSAKTLSQTAAGRERKEAIDMEAGERWRIGLNMFSKYSELAADVKAVFTASTPSQPLATS